MPVGKVLISTWVPVDFAENLTHVCVVLGWKKAQFWRVLLGTPREKFVDVMRMLSRIQNLTDQVTDQTSDAKSGQEPLAPVDPTQVLLHEFRSVYGQVTFAAEPTDGEERRVLEGRKRRLRVLRRALGMSKHDRVRILSGGVAEIVRVETPKRSHHAKVA